MNVPTIAVTIAALLLAVRASLALDLFVDSTADEPAGDPTSPACVSFPSGKCTLRAAIMVTNYFAGPNTITVPAGTFTLTRPGYDDAALIGDLDIAHDLTIQGAGSAATIIDGNGSVTGDRVFQVLPSVQDVTFYGLTIRNGNALSSSSGGGNGGGLYVGSAAHLTLVDVIVEDNTAIQGGGIYANVSAAFGSVTMDFVAVRGNTATQTFTAPGTGGGINLRLASSSIQASIAYSQVYNNTANTGGGVYVDGNASASLTIVGSEVYSNTAVGGGGISNGIPLYISDSRLHDNHASPQDGGALMSFSPYVIQRTALEANSAGGFGGAIYDLQTNGNSTGGEFAHIEGSTLSGNGAQHGGAIYHDDSNVTGSPLFLLNSTISGNTASGGPVSSGGPNGGGGGVFLHGGQTLLLNTTIAGNHVNLHGGPGGGLYLMTSADFRARNSLIANNWLTGTVITGNIPDDGYTNGTITGELSYDLVQTTTNFVITGPQGGNVIGQDPKLGPLQDNGGQTQTRALLVGSPAINAGDPAGCMKNAAATTPLTTDQRQAPRPNPVVERCDIGAFEWVPPFTLDIDASGSTTKYDALTDGLLVIRHMSGWTGTSLTANALASTATRTDPTVVGSYLNAYDWALDIDGDGIALSWTDGLLIVRYLLGFRGAALMQGAVANGAVRNTSASIEAYLGTLTP